MKTIIILSIIAVAAAAPLDVETMSTEVKDVVPIVRSTQNFETDGSYKFSFETADGLIREETGSIVNPGKEDAYVARVGSYKFKTLEGDAVEVHYTADTKGFLPRGTNIPEGPVVAETLVVPTPPETPAVRSEVLQIP